MAGNARKIRCVSLYPVSWLDFREESCYNLYAKVC